MVTSFFFGYLVDFYLKIIRIGENKMNKCEICGQSHEPDCITLERAKDEMRKLSDIELAQQSDYWYECQKDKVNDY